MIQNKKILEMSINALGHRKHLFSASMRFLGYGEITIDDFLQPEKIVKDFEGWSRDKIIAWIVSEVDNINERMLQRPPPRNESSWDAEEPIWKILERTEDYQAIKLWPSVCKKMYAIGTCTAGCNFDGVYIPDVKKATPGVLIDLKAIDLLPINWRSKIKNIPPNYLTVVFGEYTYFVDPKHLKRLKYDRQTKLF